MAWRNVGQFWRAKHLRKTTNAIRDRLRFGMEEYGDCFQGDPLQHAREEALDMLFYLEVLDAQRRELCVDCQKKIGLDRG